MDKKKKIPFFVYLVFRIHSGPFYFALLSSPIYKLYRNKVFRSLIRYGNLVIYLDDFIIPVKNLHKAFEKVSAALETAFKYGLELN